MSVRSECDGPVTTVVLDRPEARNAVDREHADALVEAFRAFELDDSALVAVLWGAGGTFCAGADLKRMDNRVEAEGDGPMGPSRLELSKPVIAAVAGHAVAGGLELACWCDLRVVEETAVFGVFCRRFGVPLIDGGTVRLPRIVGLGRALDLILTGRAVSAEEALRIGLANRVVPDGGARPAAEALAHEIAAFPQPTMRADRASVFEGLGLPVDEAMRREFERGLGLLEEARRGADRFTAGEGRHGHPRNHRTREAGVRRRFAPVPAASGSSPVRSLGCCEKYNEVPGNGRVPLFRSLPEGRTGRGRLPLRPGTSSSCFAAGSGCSPGAASLTRSTTLPVFWPVST